MEDTNTLLKQLLNELQTLTNGLKDDLAYRRQTRFTALEPIKVVSLGTAVKWAEFSEPVNHVTIAIAELGTSATKVYVGIESTAGTDSIELNANLRVLSFGDIPIKRISFAADGGSATIVEAFGLRGG